MLGRAKPLQIIWVLHSSHDKSSLYKALRQSMMDPAIATQAVRHHHQRIGSRPQPGVFHQGQHPSAGAGNRDGLKRRVKNTHANIDVCNLGDNAAHPNA